jgi:hypothetical protein
MFSLAGILGFITGLAGPISAITKSITGLKEARLRADTDQERMKIDAEVQELHGRKAVLITEAGQRIAGTINATIRAALAIGPVSYVLKYYFWDKVIGSFVGCANLPKGPAPAHCATFVTDGLNAQMAAVLTAVLAFYLLYDLNARYRKR